MPTKKTKTTEKVEPSHSYASMTPDARALCMLEDLLILSRRYGVLKFEGSIPGTPSLVKFDLAPMLASNPEPVQPSTPQVAASQPESGVKRTQKLGKDGLTADEQRELLGRQMDAED